jgi:hypothetical protein
MWRIHLMLWHWAGTLNMHLDTKAGDAPCDEAPKKGDNCPVKAYSGEKRWSSETRIHLSYQDPSGHNHGKVCPRIFQDDWTVNREGSLGKERRYWGFAGKVLSASEDSSSLLLFYSFYLLQSFLLIYLFFCFFFSRIWLISISYRKLNSSGSRIQNILTSYYYYYYHHRYYYYY